MDGFTWISLEVIDDGSIVVELTEDVSKESLMFQIGKYETEDISDSSFKVLTGMSARKAKKFQEKITRVIENEFFALA